MNTPKADQTTSNTQQIVLPIEIQGPNTKSTDYRQIFPIANIKRGISADQNLLIPIDPSQWLKEDNFIYILTSLLELLDLSKFFSKYRSDGIGASFYHPKNMLGIILYSISRGEYSSRKIERNCVTDIGYWLAGGRITPDHTTIYRFKKDFQEEFNDVFYQIAKIYLKLGLGRFGVIAVDGSKFGCNASLSANHSVKWIQSQFQKAFKESIDSDNADNEKGAPSEVEQHTLPDNLSTKKQRLEKLTRAMEVLQEERKIGAEKQQEQIDQRIAQEEATGMKSRGRKLNEPQFTPLPGDKVNITDPDSKIMKSQTGFKQGFNGQILADENQVVLVAHLTNDQTDQGQLEPLYDEFMDLLATTGIPEKPHTVLADAGYCNYNSILHENPNGPRFLFATSKEYKIPLSDIYDGALFQLDEFCRRMEDIPPTIPILAEMGSFVWHLFIDRQKPVKPEGVTKAVVGARVRSSDGRELYRKRKKIVEPVFGQIKYDRRFTRFSMKGKGPCSGEFFLVLICHNLVKFKNLGVLELLKSGKRNIQKIVGNVVNSLSQSVQNKPLSAII